MFKEFSDAELVVMWHRLNQDSESFYSTYEMSGKLVGCMMKLEQTHAYILWVKVNKECSLRKIHVHTLCKTMPVEVITYENKEVPIE